MNVSCWNCSASLTVGKDNRYCPYCGARHYQDCPYGQCSGGVSVFDATCDECGKPVLHCPDCYELSSVEHAMCKRCDVALVERLGAFPTAHGSEAAPHVTTALAEVSAGRVAPKLAINSVVCRPVIRYGRLFLARCENPSNGNWQMLACDERGEHSVPWRSTSFVFSGKPTDGSQNTEITAGLGRVALFSSQLPRGEKIRLYDALDGGHEPIPDNVEWDRARCRFAGPYLVVLGCGTDGVERLNAYRVEGEIEPVRVLSEKLGRVSVEDMPGYRPHILVTSAGVIIGDHGGCLRRWPLGQNDCPDIETLCTSLGTTGTRLCEISFDEESKTLLALVVSDKGYDIHRMKIDESPALVISGRQLALDRMAAVGGKICLLEQPNDPVFRVWDITSARQPLWEHRVGDVNDFLLVHSGARDRVVYVAADRGARRACSLTIDSRANVESLANFGPDSDVHLMYANGQLWGCELDTGQLYCMPLPT